MEEFVGFPSVAETKINNNSGEKIISANFQKDGETINGGENSTKNGDVVVDKNEQRGERRGNPDGKADEPEPEPEDEAFEGEEEDEEEEEEVVEPPFKYIRLLNDLVEKIYKRDACSCLAVHCKYLVVGTERGFVYVLDHAGNMIPKKVVQPHSVAVNQLSIDAAGEFIASCANDGKVAIYGLCDGQLGQIVVMDRPIRAVAIDPDYGRIASARRFVTGDRNLIVHERGFITRHKQFDVFAGKERDGYIHLISWKGPYIAFANDTGVRVYDKSSDTMITHVERRHDLTLRSELYPARISWYDDRNFVIGWANTVTICAIKDAACVGPDTRNKLVEIRYLWEIPNQFVAGVAFSSGGNSNANCANPNSNSNSNLINSKSAGSAGSFGFGGGRGGRLLSTSTSVVNNEAKIWHELVLFCVCQRPSEIEGGGQKPEYENTNPEVEAMERPMFPRVQLIEPVTFNTFFVATEDIIEMQDSEKLLCRNFHMASLDEDATYFLLCNRDLIQVRPSNDDDHIDWLLSNKQYDRALTFAKDRCDRLTKHDAHSVARQFLAHLLEDDRFEEAAKLCADVCVRRKDSWEEYVTRFEEHGQLKRLAPYLPTHDPQLEAECYQAVLLDFLEDDAHAFKEYIGKWSPDLYRVGAMINETLNRIYAPKNNSGYNTPNVISPPAAGAINKTLEPDDRILLTALAQLYTYERRYDRAFAIYLKLEDNYVFHLINQYRLFPMVKDKIHELMTIDTELAVRLLLENEDSLPARTVMTQLSRQPRLQLAYLDRLFARGEGAEFADLAVTLYAEYNRPRLLPFLRNNGHYRLDKALEVCRRRSSTSLVPEVVFLLGRGGNRKEALKVIINQSGDINQAIDFCKEHDDRDLWTDLIDYSVSQRPEFVTTLMRQIGTHVDPAMLIRKIPPKSVIPKLRESLVKLLDDYTLQIDLQDGCRRVTAGDCHCKFRTLLSMERRGVKLDPGSKRQMVCLICSDRLTSIPARDRVAVQQDTSSGTSSNHIEIAQFRCGHSYHVTCLVRRRTASCISCSQNVTFGNTA